MPKIVRGVFGLEVRDAPDSGVSPVSGGEGEDGYRFEFWSCRALGCFLGWAGRDPRDLLSFFSDLLFFSFAEFLCLKCLQNQSDSNRGQTDSEIRNSNIFGNLI
jgi:hypothetical protein